MLMLKRLPRIFYLNDSVFLNIVNFTALADQHQLFSKVVVSFQCFWSLVNLWESTEMNPFHLDSRSESLDLILLLQSYRMECLDLRFG